MVANRGEIAIRIFRTLRELEIGTVAIYSEADRGSLHAASADEAFLVGPGPPAESYLHQERILAVAERAGAEAIHPGYGFLAENADFASACAKAGIVFVGPTPQAIAAMGDKAAAKRLMEKAGVPLVPGYHGEKQDAALLEKEAARIGFPVLIKPSGGGGGKGMRVVKDKGAFSTELEAARRESKSAFGDDRVLIERYLERPRHIEIQVFGDTHGNVVHLFERDCSVQRRHQKVLEEAPAPGLSEKKRNEIAVAAVTAAKAIAYTGAGTVEFIAEQDGRFYFMEMNTRLQVEHPVTEMITGLDLVEWQLRVAAGETLPLSQKDISSNGHAIEARIYAEDPQRDFLPATGRVLHLGFPQEDTHTRIDTGVEAGAEITPWYDPMIAKLIVHGADRPQALARLRQALAEVEIAGVTTNVAFLRNVIASRPLAAGELDTGLIDRNRSALFFLKKIAVDALAAAACAELAEEERMAQERAAGSGDPYSPWHGVDGWRLNEDSHHDLVFLDSGTRHPVRLLFLETGVKIIVDGQSHALSGERLPGGRMRVRLDGRAYNARAVRDGRDWHVFCEGDYRRLSLKEELAGLDEDARVGSLAAPMPGKIIQVMTATGAKVTKGQPLLILEAMKMEHTITAPADGVVKEIHYAAGEQVLEGVELITLEQNQGQTTFSPLT
jgi:3-methylcrotonyl-CoA carboxylase alpha subunit